MKRLFIVMFCIALFVELSVFAATIPAVVDESGYYVSGVATGKPDKDLMKKTMKMEEVKVTVPKAGMAQILQSIMHVIVKNHLLRLISVLGTMTAILGLFCVGGINVRS